MPLPNTICARAFVGRAHALTRQANRPPSASDACRPAAHPSRRAAGATRCGTRPGCAQREIGIEHDPVHTVMATGQQIAVPGAELIGHPPSVGEPDRTGSAQLRRKGPPDSGRSPGSGVKTFRRRPPGPQPAPPLPGPGPQRPAISGRGAGSPIAAIAPVSLARRAPTLYPSHTRIPPSRFSGGWRPNPARTRQ